MYYRIHQIKLQPGEDKNHIPQKIKKKTGALVKDWIIRRESIDARDKKQIRVVYTVDFSCDKTLKLPQAPDLSYKNVNPGSAPMNGRPVIVGFGPCGIFAALILADMGYRPIVLERGRAMEQRVRDVEHFWKTGELDEVSNVQFGEGGAGTFSDGKLTTGIKDPRIAKVLETFVQAGANPEILYKQKPHIGTDVLRRVVVNLRKEIQAKGGEIRFESRVTDLVISDGKLKGVVINGAEQLGTDHLVLALGHSSRDTFRMLRDRRVPMEQKPFSIGVRIEHPQEWIDRAQYGDPALAEILGPADYKLSHHSENGRGVYTFCMCPGGEVIMAASQKGLTVTNGMSYSARAGQYANSGLLVDVRTSDFSSEDVLAGVEFQEKYEKMAFENGNPPRTTWKQFAEKGDPVAASLPDFAVESIKEAMPYLGKKLRGFDDPSVKMTAVESRSSSPVRILRGEALESDIEGLYPAGEGAGYAGGITSAAVDGIKVAEEIIRRCSPPAEK
ncbi:NAD(FAD)-utilizing dehydrogenase [Anaerovorax odorimutans]|uniref:NAD(FAD)-utilizing dehydrogenase n=1 Tax=Anaerovorax odorimutans TaxID=109327 RepID=A0ABT1RMD1_9FIRM|nr:FAD-dependent oxidoreductase [Anaerovorax odorimutans]MCQ4636349.1 NAD(FAD)-utilizing dehydrogenase [Anaerovorax odorimutans]